MEAKKIAVKFLLSNSLAGSLIGTGGQSVKELIAVTEAKINVSSTTDLYPGTSDRVVLITGAIEEVALAQTLIWEMVAQVTKTAVADRKNLKWNPKAAAESLGSNDSVEVSAKLSIPSAASGQILGKSGSNIKLITEESGAKISMSSKEDALFTQERILSISGEAGKCVKATDLILSKLAEQAEVPNFTNKGTVYRSPLSLGIPGARRSGPAPSGATPSTAPVAPAVEDAVSSTTINLAIPNEIIGNIFGRKGATMREITSLSGAKITVSPKGDFVDGSSNRIVTITGSPSATQAAHILLTQRLRIPSNPAPRK